MLHTLKLIQNLSVLPSGKLLINTINAWSYVVASKDETFAKALMIGDVLIPDGQSIIWATRFLDCKCVPPYNFWNLKYRMRIQTSGF